MVPRTELRWVYGGTPIVADSSIHMVVRCRRCGGCLHRGRLGEESSNRAEQVDDVGVRKSPSVKLRIAAMGLLVLSWRKRWRLVARTSPRWKRYWYPPSRSTRAGSQSAIQAPSVPRRSCLASSFWQESIPGAGLAGISGAVRTRRRECSVGTGWCKRMR